MSKLTHIRIGFAPPDYRFPPAESSRSTARASWHRSDLRNAGTYPPVGRMAGRRKSPREAISGVERACPADDAMHLVTLAEEQLRQIRPILPGDAGDQCLLCHKPWSGRKVCAVPGRRQEELTGNEAGAQRSDAPYPGCGQEELTGRCPGRVKTTAPAGVNAFWLGAIPRSPRWRSCLPFRPPSTCASGWYPQPRRPPYAVRRSSPSAPTNCRGS